MAQLPLGGQITGSEAPEEDLWHYERRLQGTGYGAVAGVDEAGRGALAGPVVAAAVIFGPGAAVEGVGDSKMLTPERRAVLYRAIRAHAQAVGVGVVQADEIDRVNILRATHIAMARALARLRPQADYVLIDGDPVRSITTPNESIVKGDQRNYLIAAASIVAKVTRDSIMVDLADLHPGYGFDGHKGYGTATHCRAVEQLGPCPVHRKTFAPIATAAERTLPGLG